MSSTTNKGRLRPRGTGSLPASYPITPLTTSNNNNTKSVLHNNTNTSHNNNSSSFREDFFPLIATSGYLTKKSRGLTSRWLRRWWQLLGDGTLIYFKGEERLKVLGEIDIAHTCYDVQLGGEFCHGMSFPPVIPTNCCLSVSVLKRTYYLFAPTPREASKWAESLRSASYLLNRDRPRELSANPAVLVAEEELEATPPPPPSVPPPPSSHKPLPPPPPHSSSIDDSTEGEDEHKQLPHAFQQSLSHSGHHNLSVPDLRFDNYYYYNNNGGNGRRGSAGRVRSVYNSFQASQLSSSQSSNSPPQHYMSSQPSPPHPPYPSRSQPTQSTPTTTAQANPHSSSINSKRRRSHSFLVNSTTEDSTINKTQQQEVEQVDSQRKDTTKKKHRTARRQSSKDGINSTTSTKHSKSSHHEHNKKRLSHTSHSDLLSTSINAGTNTLPNPGQLTRYKWKSEYNTSTGIDATYTRLEELQRQEESIKKRLRELQKNDRLSYTGQGVPVFPLLPTENFSPPQTSFDTPPTRYSFHDNEEENEGESYDLLSSSGGGVHFRNKPPKKPPRKAPKPVLKRIPTPYTGMINNDDKPQGFDNENIAPLNNTTLNTSNNNNNNNNSSSMVYSTCTVPLSTVKTPNSSTPINTGTTLVTCSSSVMGYSPVTTTTAVGTNSRLVYKDDSKRKSSAIRYYEANIWVKSELNKLIEQIKLHGKRDKEHNNKIVISFGELMDKTEGMFEALLGTILTARKHQIVHFEGDILLKGEHDEHIITLLVENLHVTTNTTPTTRGYE